MATPIRPWALLQSRRFLPLFLTQFLGALNDNFFKNAMIILVTYRTSQEWHMAPQTLVTIAGALFVSPYILLCATSGRLADKFDKARIARLVKWAEVVFMLLATVGFLGHWTLLLFFVLVCMGAHSAFFSPVKYALLPDHLEEHELIDANALIESITFVATLLGTIAGGALILRAGGEITVSVLMLGIAAMGVAASQFIPPSRQLDASVTLHINPLRETWDVLKRILAQEKVRTSILANSWFWFPCMTFLTLFPAYIRNDIGADEYVVTLFLTLFSLGIGVGAVMCGMLLKGRASWPVVVASAVGMSVFIIDLYAASPDAPMLRHQTLMPIGVFLADWHAWRMAADFLCISLLGGCYIVPLYALIQQHSAPHQRAQAMACNNIMNGIFMVLSSLFALFMFACGYHVREVFLAAGLLNLAAALWLFLTPHVESL